MFQNDDFIFKNMLAFTRPEQDLLLEKKVGGSNINLQFSISNDGFTK